MVRNWSGEVSELIAQLIADRPAAVMDLLARHVDDGNGHCRVCVLGAQRGFHTWPCTIYAAAVLAERGRGR
ncbi:hypothetical protein FHX44_115192 [Pseudonocardia hierapolitana]|uniref:Uncharacterized protein n=1 Tax=Pseudonocardia hierapolitana TaxID=1128676 RepID=A0A561SWM7_9PSEU|nr:hypothetical protein [Pseudonocardia hierapolitana]TWF79264.1 hypothetical protein FHX44_115192 [Pseudonocardia hierapolitana]